MEFFEQRLAFFKPTEDKVQIASIEMLDLLIANHARGGGDECCHYLKRNRIFSEKTQAGNQDRVIFFGDWGKIAVVDFGSLAGVHWDAEDVVHWLFLLPIILIFKQRHSFLLEPLFHLHQP
jgi:hypothetical protein